jgi:hypothetical protein
VTEPKEDFDISAWGIKIRNVLMYWLIKPCLDSSQLLEVTRWLLVYIKVPGITDNCQFVKNASGVIQLNMEV